MKKSLVIRAKTSLQAFYILALKTVFVSNVFSTIILYHSSFEFARGFISFFCKGGMSMYIFTAYITSKDGRRLYAKQYGMKAFRIWIDDDMVKN